MQNKLKNLLEKVQWQYLDTGAMTTVQIKTKAAQDIYSHRLVHLSDLQLLAKKDATQVLEKINAYKEAEIVISIGVQDDFVHVLLNDVEYENVVATFKFPHKE